MKYFYQQFQLSQVGGKQPLTIIQNAIMDDDNKQPWYKKSFNEFGEKNFQTKSGMKSFNLQPS